MGKPKINIFRIADETGETYKRMEAAGIEVQRSDGNWVDTNNQRENDIELIFDPDTTIAAGGSGRNHVLTRKTLESAPDLRMVAYYSIGYENVDLDAATEMGIVVIHSPTESNWGGVAEGTMAMMLDLLKKVRQRDRHVKEGGWRDMSLKGTYMGARQIDDYEGITVGIVGLGRIGSRLADLLAPWRVKLIAWDPYVDEAKYVHHNVKSVDLETLLKESDVVSIHCNLTAETGNLIDEAALALMKPTAILINAARGPIVDVDALFTVLDRDRLAGAALDVLPEEPPDPQLPLLGLGDKVLLSPHMITQNHGTGLQMAVPWVEKAVFDVLNGKLPRHVVNPDVLPKWRQRFEGKGLI